MKITALIKKLGAQVVRLLTIWARQNLQLLTSDLKAQAALLLWAASLPYCTGCCTGTTCQNFRGLSDFLRAPKFSLFPMENPKIYLGFQVSYHCTENLYMITTAVQIQLQHFQAPKWRPSSTLAEVARNG